MWLWISRKWKLKKHKWRNHVWKRILQILQALNYFNVFQDLQVYRFYSCTHWRTAWWSDWLWWNCLWWDCLLDCLLNCLLDYLLDCLLDCLMDCGLCGNEIVWPKFQNSDSMWNMWIRICNSLKLTEAPKMETWKTIWEQTMKQRTQLPIEFIIFELTK